MRVTTTSIATGALAGVTSALLVLAAMSHISLSFVFLILAGIPVFIAGLGFGVAASAVALIASFAALAMLETPLFALTILALPQIPAAWMSYEANLARPASEIGGPEDVTAWYPLSDMLLHLAVLVALALSVTLVMTGYDRGIAEQIVNAASEIMAEQDPALGYDAASRQLLAALYYYLMPLNQGLMSVIMIFASYYFSALIVRMSTRSLRPREDMPSTLRMHRGGAFFFLGGLALMFYGGMPGVIGATVCGAFGGGFLIAGLAAFHYRTRGKTWRLPALWLAYLTIFISGFFFIAAGLVDTRRAIALTPAANPDNKDN